MVRADQLKEDVLALPMRVCTLKKDFEYTRLSGHAYDTQDYNLLCKTLKGLAQVQVSQLYCFTSGNFLFMKFNCYTCE